MKKAIRTLLSIIAVSAITSFAADLSPADQQFLGGYEKIRSALVADDLASAKNAAAAMGEAGTTLAASSSLKQARAEFSTLSDSAVKLAKGQPGFYVVRCTMVKKDWVQTSPKIGNPYAGKEMPGCGEIVK